MTINHPKMLDGLMQTKLFKQIETYRAYVESNNKMIAPKHIEADYFSKIIKKHEKLLNKIW